MTGTVRKGCLIALGVATLVQAGCIAAVAGAAGAGAVAGYMYYNGLLYRDYRVGLNEALPPVRAALAAQKFVIDQEATEPGSVTVHTKTADGYTVRVHLDTVPGPPPADGPVTRIGVRVGFAGDDTVTARILDEISARLAPVVAAPVPVNTLSGPGPQTAPPPLATGPGADPNRLVPIPADTPAGSR